jgi:hypothetical protein
MPIESNQSRSWVELSHRENHYDVKLQAAAGRYSVGLRWGVSTEDGEPGIVALFDNGSVAHVVDIDEPRSVGVASTGRFVVADWIEYGTTTGSRVMIFERTGEAVFSDELDHGAVLVDINDAGTHIAVSTYESAVRIYEIETGGLTGLHHCSIVDRPVVEFTTVDQTEQIALRESDAEEVLYSITLSGETLDESEAANTRQYISSFDPDGSEDWISAAAEFRSAYATADTESLQNYIVEQVADHGLRNVSTERALKPIIAELEAWYRECADSNHHRVLAIRLADAYYRYAKAGRASTGSKAFWSRIEIAQEYAAEGLPWYEAKSQLAKIHRIQSRTYERRNEPHEAKAHLERIRELEEEYEVSLLNKADKDRLASL